MITKPGTLYLGHELTPDSGERTGRPVELDSDRLTTHGIIVGMTGSGKTGLGVVLLEEILASGVPALILDPKGDMGNLLLNFPEFRPGDFEPWVDGGEAKRKGISAGELAAREAEKWRAGLEGSGVSPGRMDALRKGVDLRIITPGSTAGIPLNLVGDLSPPAASWETAGESIRDEIEGLVSGLLVMVGIEADPLTSREHILLSNLVEHGWREGRALDLPTLLRQIQDPPFRRLGVFELEAFYPSRDRQKLAMRLNGLMASPSFAEWMMGEPLETSSLLFAPDGRPRASIIHLAHLSDSERMFVVTLLLTRFITWMRQQPGTSELRALVYADEVMGFAPPSAAPPSKRPILTLYKQARAHGVGVVMATQNPVDLDYKLMSNAGTWMVGRLQTERDKARILEGLRSASGDVDVATWDARIGALGKREFLLKSARSSAPTLFTTRWAMSYLRGPLTRAELLRLRPAPADPRRPPSAADPAPVPGGTAGPTPPSTGTPGAASSGAGRTPESGTLGPDETGIQPRVAEGIPVRFLDSAAPWRDDAGIGPGPGALLPGLAVRVRMLFDERKGGIRREEEWEAVIFPLTPTADAEDAVAVDHDPRDFRDAPPADAVYTLSDAPIDRKSFFTDLERTLEEWLYLNRTTSLAMNEALGLYGRPGEDEETFRRRCMTAAEEAANDEAEKLRARYASRLDTLERQVAQAERRVRELDVDHGQRRQQEVISAAGEVLTMFLGGRRSVRGLSGIASRRSQTRRAEERLRSAEEKVEDYEGAIRDLEEELEREIREIWDRWRETAEDIGVLEIPLERNDVALEDLLLFWAPAP